MNQKLKQGQRKFARPVKKEPLHVMLGDNHRQKLEELAIKLDVSLAEVARRAIMAYTPIENN
jgi:hypothetical protein